MKAKHILPLISLTALPVLAPAQPPPYVYAPASILNAREGNSSLSPLDWAPISIRFQQVFQATNFLAVMPAQPLLIRSLEFRVDALVGHDFDTILTNIQVDLSTTSRNPDGLSPVFDENVGSDRRTLINSSAYHLRGSGGLGTLGPWGILFNFGSAPFIYDPTQGNLLLEIRSLGSGNTTAFDAVDAFGDSVSSVFGLGGIPAQGTTSTVGLATLFVAGPIPEPSSFLLFGTGLFAFGFARRLRAARRK